MVWNWKTRALIHIASLADPILSFSFWDLYLFPKSDHSTVWEHFAILWQGDTVRIIPLAGAPLCVRDGKNQRYAVAGPSGLPTSPSSIQTYRSYQPLPQYNHIAQLAKPTNSPYPNSSHVIAIVEDQLVALPLGTAGQGADSFLLSSTVVVIVRVGSRCLRAESARQAKAVPEGTNQKVIVSSAISQNGRFLACGYQRGHLEVYDLDSGSSTPENIFLGVECYDPAFLAFVLEDTHVVVWGEEPHWRNVLHRDLAVHLVRLSKDSQPATHTKVGEVQRKKIDLHYTRECPPVMSSAMSMSIELEWADGAAPRPILTRFEPDVSYQQVLSLPSAPSIVCQRAFSPDNRYVGIADYKQAWVWSTSSGDLIYTVKGHNFGINHVPAALRALLSSPFPTPSQITRYAFNAFRNLTDPPPPSAPPNGDATSAALSWDSAVFVLIPWVDPAHNSDEYPGAQISWRSNGFMIADAKTGHIRLDNGRLCWVHPSFHSSFYYDKPAYLDGPRPVWVQRGGTHILLGGRKGVLPVVLDVGP